MASRAHTAFVTAISRQGSPAERDRNVVKMQAELAQAMANRGQSNQGAVWKSPIFETFMDDQQEDEFVKVSISDEGPDKDETPSEDTVVRFLASNAGEAAKQAEETVAQLRSFDWGQIVATAGVGAAVSTFFSFGIKPIVEWAVSESMKAHGRATTEVLLGATIAGGAYAAFASPLAGLAASMILNAYFGGWKPKGASERDKQFADFLQFVVPVMVSFCGAGALRGLATEGATPLVAAAGKGAASVAAALFANAAGEMVRQSCTDTFERTEPQSAGETWDKYMSSGSWTSRKALKDFIFRLLGSVGGNIAAGYVAKEDFLNETPRGLGANQAFTSMLTYLTAWFVGIHGGAFVGDTLGGQCCAPPVNPEEPAPGPEIHRSKSKPQTVAILTPVDPRDLTEVVIEGGRSVIEESSDPGETLSLASAVHEIVADDVTIRDDIYKLVDSYEAAQNDTYKAAAFWSDHGDAIDAVVAKIVLDRRCPADSGNQVYLWMCKAIRNPVQDD